MPLIAGATSAYFAGVQSGKLGVALKAGVIAGATAFALQQVGNATGHNPFFDDPLFLPNVFGHALVFVLRELRPIGEGMIKEVLIKS